MASTCIFCGDPKVTREHVFPKWLRKLFPEDKVGPAVSGFTHGIGADQIYRPFPGRAVATVTARIVCKPCNTVWMHDLETAAQPLLTPMIFANEADLDASQQLTVATWAVRTAMTTEMTLKREHLFSQEDRGFLYLQRCPPTDVRVQTAAYQGNNGPFAFFKVGARFSREGVEVDSLVRTIQLGCLIIRVMSLPPADNRPFEQFAIPRDVQIPLIPPVEQFRWPPPFSLDDAGLARFSRLLDVRAR